MRSSAAYIASAIWNIPVQKAGLSGVGERERLLGRERVALGRRLVRDVATARHRVEPLADVTLTALGPLRELRRSDRPARGERTEETEALADHDEHPAHRRPHVAHHFAHELSEFLFDRLS